MEKFEKTYKKVVDDNKKKNGKQENYMELFWRFNLLYGNRASTTAKVTYDNVKGTQYRPQSEESSGEHGEGAIACSASTSAHQYTGKIKPSKSVTGDHYLEPKKTKNIKLSKCCWEINCTRRWNDPRKDESLWQITGLAWKRKLNLR